MKPTLVLLAPELAKHARTIADRLDCAVVPKRVPNPTLERHGLTKKALWHILTHTVPRRAVADLYVGGRVAALRVARELSKLLGVQIELLDNTATPADLKAHPRTIVAANPSRSPAARARRAHARRTARRKQRRVLASGRGGAQSEYYATRSTERGVARRARRGNPGYAVGDIVQVAGKRCRIAQLLGDSALVAHENGTLASVPLARLASAGSRRRLPNPKGHDPELDAAVTRIRRGLKKRGGVAWSVTRGTGSVYGWIYIRSPRGDMNADERKMLARLLGLETVHHQGVMIPSGSRERDEYVARAERGADWMNAPLVIDRPGGPFARKPNRRKGGDPRTRGYPDIGTPALGKITVRGTTYTVHSMPSKFTPWYLVGPRGAQFGLIRYQQKPWLFYAMNASRPMGSVGKLEGVTFTGETFDTLTEFTDPGPKMNPARSKTARARRSAAGRWLPSRKVRRATAAGHTAKAEHAKKRHVARGLARMKAAAARRTNPKGNVRRFSKYGAGGAVVNAIETARGTWFVEYHGGAAAAHTEIYQVSGRRAAEAFAAAYFKGTLADALKAADAITTNRRGRNPGGRVDIDDATRKHMLEWLRQNRTGRFNTARAAIYRALRQDPEMIERGLSWPQIEERGMAEHRLAVPPRTNPRRPGSPQAGRRKARAQSAPGRRRNPDDPEKRAAEVVRTFQDRGPVPVTRKRMRRPKPLTTAAAELGKLVGVVYRSDKFDGKTRDYEHDFSTPLPSLVTDPDGAGLHIVGGRYKVTSDGIVN